MPDRRRTHPCIANIELGGPFVGALDEVVILRLHLHKRLPDTWPAHRLHGAVGQCTRALFPASPRRISTVARSVHQPPATRKGCPHAWRVAPRRDLPVLRPTQESL